jgi:hypothetical protein
MNLVPAIIFFTGRRRLAFGATEGKIWFYFSLASLAMPILLFLLPSSTAVDRIALYLIPIQLAVLPRTGNLIKSQQFAKVLVIGYSALVLFTWLNFAVHAKYWVPYQLYPRLVG